MESIWLKDIRENTEHPAQSGPSDTGRKSRTDLPPRAEVAVIGAGMAGMLCARMLADQGADVAVLEARVAGHGQTKNTTAKSHPSTDLSMTNWSGQWDMTGLFCMQGLTKAPLRNMRG